MSLIKTSLLNGVAVIVKVATALVLNKVLAIYVGPAGYAIIGQFQNAVSVVVGLAGGLIGPGVTKATAQYFDDETKQHHIWQTAVRLSLLLSLTAGCILLLSRHFLSAEILHRPDMSSIFVWLALALPAMAANVLLLAIINGRKELHIYITTNIASSLLAMSVTGCLAYLFGLYGTLVAFTINPAIGLLTTAAMVYRRNWFKAKFLLGKTNRAALHELSGFGLMSLASTLTVPISYMLIRDHLATKLGLTASGYWQASWKISEIYLMLVTTTLSVYYLPRLAEIRSASELKSEIFKVYRIVMPTVIGGAITIYLLRDFIINTLFTHDYIQMRELFSWQLTGDVIKIGSWITGYILIGRGMVKIFLSVEIIFSFSFVLLSWILVDKWGLNGVPIAYTLNYLICWPYVTYWASKEIKKMEGRHAEN